MHQKKWLSEVMVEEAEGARTVRETLSLADEYAAKREWQAARILYARASEVSIMGKLEYARFLMRVPELENMTRYELLKKAEGLLLWVERNGNTEMEAEACLLLANLYRRFRGRELSALGYLLRGKSVDLEDEMTAGAFWKAILRLNLADAEEDPHGCYLVGMEASRYTDNAEVINWACYFLQTAVEYGKGPYVGVAALRLAELYQDTCPDADLAARYLRAAAEHGNPDILTRR